MDQAALLRKMTEKKADAPQKTDRTRVIAITSGKGGVGKTNIAANLAISLCRKNKKVLVLDADLGLANMDVLLGLTPKYCLLDLLNGNKELSDILIEGPEGVLILPAGSGIEELSNLEDNEKMSLIEKLDEMWQKIDYMIIDTGAGISQNVIYFNLAAQQTFVVVTPEPTSITDAYALMKILSNNYNQHKFSIIINMSKSEDEATMIFKHLTTVTDRFLNISLDLCGYVIHDNNIRNAVRSQKSLVQMYPKSDASKCIETIAQYIDDNSTELPANDGIGFFWRKMIAAEIL